MNTNNIGKVRYHIEFPTKFGINPELITIGHHPYTKKVEAPLWPTCDCYDVAYCECPPSTIPAKDLYRAYSMEPQPIKFTFPLSTMNAEMERYIGSFIYGATDRCNRPEELYIRVTRLDMFNMPAERWLLDGCLLEEYQTAPLTHEVNEAAEFSLTLVPKQLEYFQL